MLVWHCLCFQASSVDKGTLLVMEALGLAAYVINRILTFERSCENVDYFSWSEIRISTWKPRQKVQTHEGFACYYLPYSTALTCEIQPFKNPQIWRTLIIYKRMQNSYQVYYRKMGKSFKECNCLMMS